MASQHTQNFNEMVQEQWQQSLAEQGSTTYLGHSVARPEYEAPAGDQVDIVYSSMQDAYTNYYMNPQGPVGPNYTGLSRGDVLIDNLESAVNRADSLAEELSQSAINTQITQTMFYRPNLGGDGPVQTIIDNAEIVPIDFPTGPTVTGDGTQYSTTNPNDSTWSNPSTIKQVEAMWENSAAITIDRNTASGAEMERQINTHTMYNDTHINMGYGRELANGEMIVSGETPAGGISVIARSDNPEGYEYYTHRAPGVGADKLREVLDNANAKSAIREQLENAPADQPQQVLNFGPAFPDKNTPEQLQQFEGGEMLAKTPGEILAMEDGVEKLIEAHIRATRDFTQHRHDVREDIGPDTAFADYGPRIAQAEVAGTIGGMLEKHPSLNEHDITAALRITAEADEAQKVANMKNGDYSNFHEAKSAADFDNVEKLEYTDNGRGLKYNDHEGGFGMMNGDKMDALLGRMAEMQAQNPDLATTERDVASQKNYFQQKDLPEDANAREYQIEMESNAVFMRGVIEMDFGNNNTDVPEQIEIISPDGGSITVSPSMVKGGSELSQAATDGFFGNHTEGEWTIRVPEGHELESAQIKVEGVEPGGLIDKTLNREIGPRRDQTNEHLPDDLERSGDAARPDAKPTEEFRDADSDVRPIRVEGSTAPPKPQPKPGQESQPGADAAIPG